MRLTGIDPTPFHSLPYWTSAPSRTPCQRELPFFHAKAEGLPNDIGCLVLMSDLQGREYLSDRLEGTERLLGEAVAEELSLLVGLGEIPPISTVMICGDLYEYPDCRKPGGTGPVEAVFLSLSRVSEEVIAVLGNHDSLASTTKLPAKIVVLNGNVVKTNFGLRVGGLGGIIGDPKRHNRHMELCIQKRPILLCYMRVPKTQTEAGRAILLLPNLWKRDFQASHYSVTSTGLTHH